MPKQVKRGNEPIESKAAKAKRLEASRKAYEQCNKILPFAVGIILLLIIGFGLYVNNQPAIARPEVGENAPAQQTIDLRDYTIEQLQEMAEKSGDKEFGEKIEEYRVTMEAMETAAQEQLLEGDGAAEDDVVEEL
jgi:hypothetical protein